MTRTADRTLLQALGFDDPDRKNEEHDLACRFMIQPETMAKLTALLWPKAPRDLVGVPQKLPELLSTPGYSQTGSLREEVLEGATCDFAPKGHIEKPVMRDGGYFVGFADAFIVPLWNWTGSLVAYESQVVSPHRDDRAWGPWTEIARRPYDASLPRSSELLGDEYRYRGPIPLGVRAAMERRECIGVEVKIGPTSVANCIKQVKLYDAYLPGRWILATRYVVSAADRALLANEGITHIRLAAGFDAFLETVRASKPSDSPEF